MAYTGYIAEIPIADRGLVAPPVAIKDGVGALIEATNVMYHRGSLQKELGASHYNATAISGNPIILAGHDWWANPSTRRVVVYGSDGVVRMDNFGAGTFGTTVGTGWSTTAENPLWVEAGQETAGAPKKLILINGVDVPQYISGTNTTFSSFTSVPADWAPGSRPITATIHEGRVWYAVGHRLYYSTTTDHTDVNGTGSGVFVVFPGEGRYITALISFKGLLLVFKHPHGIFAIDTSSPTVADWTVSRITGAVGAAGPRAVAAIENDVLFLDAGGDFHLISAVQGYGDVAPRPISRETRIRDILAATFNDNHVHRAQIVYDPQWSQAHIVWALFSETHVYGRFIVDLAEAGRFKFRIVTRDNIASAWIGRTTTGVPKLFGGGTNGIVWKLNEEDRTVNGGSYPCSAEIAPVNFAYLDPTIAAKRKNGDFLELVADANDSQSVIVDILWDNRVVQTTVFTFGVGGSALGSFTLGISALAGFGGKNVKRRITGSGTWFSFRMRNSFASQNFSLIRAYVYFRVADERKS